MDKCREEFEKQRYWVGLFRTGVDFDVTLGEFGRYISNGTKSTDAMDLESFNEKWEAWANCWQHQQAKVEELQKRVDSIREVLDELQEQADVIRKRGQKFRDSNFLASADMMDICIKEIEQALKGEGQ
ncbi:TPA: hypothetical protein ACSB4L_002232 [Acinetobacter baumannii]|uniref:hypothetical protein n=1 Tax=Acinetobacter baumannii TaxID=470 RepID=UPI001CDBC000|nr:hypothetical protein [Acinetobacter baumannii]MCA4275596.1 hypothetical protein [Acinetobacter baumannii]